MTVDDLMADPEAEAGAAYFFGGEEGFEDFLSGFGRHAGTSVGDGEDEAFASCVPVCAFAAADEETTSVGLHGVDGVIDEVAEHLADLAFEAEDGMGCALAPFDLDMRVDQASLVDGECACDQLVAGDQLGFAGLLVEAQCLVGDDRDAAQLAIGNLEILPRLRVGGGLAREVKKVRD